MENLFEFINILTITPAILGGLIIGSVLYNHFKISLGDIYVMLVSTLAFFLLMGVTQAGMGNSNLSLEHWVSVTTLYFIFIISSIVGQRFKKPALFLG